MINQIPFLGVIKDTPDNVMVSCPYHKNGQERRPSAGIKKTDGTFHCFACGEVHTLPEVISYCFYKTNDYVGAFGWNWLLKNFATIDIENRGDIILDIDRNEKPVKQTYVTEEELADYRYYHPYMWERKLSKYAIEVFDVGYDKKTDCLTFPVRDIKGNCLFVARRSVKTKFFNYPAGIEKPLYGIYEVNQVEPKTLNTDHIKYEYLLGYRPDEIIVCESMIDALTCWTYGKYAVAMNGLGTDLQFKQLKELPCRKLILATDNDEAGYKARRRIRQNIYNKIITEYVLPNGKKDINDLTEEEFLNLKEKF